MKHEIESAQIQISVDSVGAELKSIIDKKNNTQLLYDGKDKYWNYSSPVLFPFVGRLKHGRFLFNGKSYDMPIHGFARLYEFEAEKLSEAALSFTLKSSDETRKIYPFDFKLCITYEINGSQINIYYIVENSGIDTMYFSLGAHPGFLCPIIPLKSEKYGNKSCQKHTELPIAKNEDFSDYYLEFDKEETVSLMKVTSDGLFSHERIDFLTGENRVDLNYNLFENDALVFSGLKSESVKLKSKNHDKYVIVDFKGFKYLGIWTLPGAPFLCIEPWLGHGDFEDFAGDLRDKPDIKILRPGEIFSCGLSISVF